MGYDNENDQVDDEARKEKGRVEADLMREALGRKSDIRLERGSKPYKATFIAGEKKKKEEESKTRETLKRAQEALDRHLEELHRQIAELSRKIEKLEKEIETTEDRLENKFGKDWKERLKKGELDAADGDVHKYRQQQEQKDLLWKQREELREKVETVKEKYNNAETPEQRQAVLADAKAVTLRFARTQEDTKGPKTSGLTLSETANPLQEKLQAGKDVEVPVAQDKRGTVKSSSFLAADLEGDGSYTKGIGEKGLTSQNAFKIAASQTDETLTFEAKTAPRMANDKITEAKETLTPNG
jgi:hypothetical protein